MKIGCFISQFTLEGGSLVVGDATKYDGLAKCAVDSFKKFHPEIELHYVNDTNFMKYYEKYFQSYELVDHCDWNTENRGELKVIYENGKFDNRVTLEEIRERLK
jgi:hypothetical protein